MAEQQTVLLLGATGRTGRHVLEQLLERGLRVRVVVRSARGLAAGVAEDPRLAVVEADLLSLSDEELRRQVLGCDAVISCLGHVISLRGVFGPPRDLVTRATSRLCRAIEALRPARPVKLILMSSVSVNRPGRLDTRRGRLERALLWAIRGLLPPASPFVQWVVVRPDTLLTGGRVEYALHQGLASSLFAPGSTSMASVAHFMCELVVDPEAWTGWKGKLPVVVNAAGPGG